MIFLIILLTITYQIQILHLILMKIWNCILFGFVCFGFMAYEPLSVI